MKILSVVRRGYYGSRSATEPMYLYLTEPLRQMGHEVQTFDHYESAGRLGANQATDMLADTIRAGDFHVTLYQTAGQEPIDTAALRGLSERFCIAAWNSDDDWQWHSGTSRIAADFTYMITTYPQIYRDNHARFPNLLLSQWACFPALGHSTWEKDMNFSFAGAIYGSRNGACRFLRRQAGLQCFGRGSRLVRLGVPYFKGSFNLPLLSGAPIDYLKVHALWNRTRVSYTPMGGGPNGSVLSIKSRAFDMGLSGTLMLSELSPDLDLYYDPGTEFVTFEGLEDCAEKAKYYLAHESERARIAGKYRQRTLDEHLWNHRFAALFRQIGI